MIRPNVSVVAFSVALLLPVPDVPSPGQMDCLCSLYGRDIGSVKPVASYPDVGVEYSDDSHSGQCDGPGPVNCPQVSACAGTVSIHVVPKAGTGFTDYPGVFGVAQYGTFDFTKTLNNCGQLRKHRVTVWNNWNGDNMGNIIFWIFCTWCSDSSGDA
jgi:hypothetical protein